MIESIWQYGGLFRGNWLEILIGVAILAYVFGFVSCLYFAKVWWKGAVLSSWEAARELECAACRKRGDDARNA